MVITFYHQTKTPISFWCRRRIEPQISYTIIRNLELTVKISVGTVPTKKIEGNVEQPIVDMLYYFFCWLVYRSGFIFFNL